MNTIAQNDNALREQGEVGKAKNSSSKSIRKIDRVIEAMKLPQGINRFEAERIGDHCLNSTAAVIRRRYGDKMIQRWETVPSRYSADGVRVLRYWL